MYSQLHRFYRQIIIIWQKCPIPQNFYDIFIAILSNAGFSVKCLPLYLTFHVFQEKRIVFMEQHPHNEQKYLTQRIVTRKTSPTKGRARGSTKNGIVKILQNSVMNAFGFYGCYRLRAFPRRAVCLDLKCFYTPSSVKNWFIPSQNLRLSRRLE